jgi:hypothetical protein
MLRGGSTRNGAIKKIKDDVTFDPLPTTSSSKVKPDETPPKFSITCDECAKIIFDQAELFEFSVHDNLIKLIVDFGKKKSR